MKTLHPSLCLVTPPRTRPSVRPSAQLPAHHPPTTSPPRHAPTRPSVHPLTTRSVHPSIHPPALLSVHPSVRLSMQPTICPPTHYPCRIHAAPPTCLTIYSFQRIQMHQPSACHRGQTDAETSTDQGTGSPHRWSVSEGAVCELVQCMVPATPHQELRADSPLQPGLVWHVLQLTRFSLV